MQGTPPPRSPARLRGAFGSTDCSHVLVSGLRLPRWAALRGGGGPEVQIGQGHGISGRSVDGRVPGRPRTCCFACAECSPGALTWASPRGSSREEMKNLC